MRAFGQNRILYFFGSLFSFFISFYTSVRSALYLITTPIYFIIYPIYFVAYILPSKGFDMVCKMIEKIPLFGPLITWILRSLINLFIIYILYVVVYTRLPIPVRVFLWQVIYTLKDWYIKIQLQLFSFLGHEVIHEITSPFLNSFNALWLIIQSWISMYNVLGNAKQILNFPDELYHGAVDVKDKFFDVVHGINDNLGYFVPSLPYNISYPSWNVSSPSWNMSYPSYNMSFPSWNMSFPTLPSIPPVPALPPIPWALFRSPQLDQITNNGTAEL